MIIGEKVLLREFRQTDLDRMHSWVNDEDVTKNLVFAVFPRTLEDSKRFLDKQLNRTDDSYVHFVITEKEDPEQNYIGSVGLKNIDYKNRKAEFTIAIAYRDKIGRGLGTEATKLILRFAFFRLGLNKIYLKYIKFNESARRSYEKAGFRVVCELKEDIYYDGSYHSQIYMEILRSEFERSIKESATKAL